MWKPIAIITAIVAVVSSKYALIWTKPSCTSKSSWPAARSNVSIDGAAAAQ